MNMQHVLPQYLSLIEIDSHKKTDPSRPVDLRSHPLNDEYLYVQK